MANFDLGGIGKLSRKRLVAVTREHRGCFRAQDVVDCLQITPGKARTLLANWFKHGWIQKVRPGVYVAIEMVSESPEGILIDPWVLASQLFAPCYIGGWSACQYWDFTEQIFDKIWILTSRRINGKVQKAGNFHFLLKKTDPVKFFGLKSVWKETVKVQVSDPHKTIIDILDDPSLAGGIRFSLDMLQKYLRSKHSNTSLLLEYVHKMNNKTIFKRLGFLLSYLKFEDTAVIEECRNNISQGNSQIDPSIKGHRLIKKWGLWLSCDFENPLPETEP